MKDLIAKLQMDANCALGAIWMHIDAQEKRIAELEAQQAFGIGETYANALSRIAELEAQIAAAAAPVVEQQPVLWYDATAEPHEDHGQLDESTRQVAILGTTRGPWGAYTTPLYAAHQDADTDKLREAILNTEVSTSGSKGYAKAWNEGAEHMRDAILNLIEATALQAPVREVPDDLQIVPKISTSKMDRAGEAVIEGENHCDCGNYPMPNLEKVFSAMLAAAPLPAAPVQPEPKP